MPHFYKYDPVSATSIASDAGGETVSPQMQEGAAPFMGPVDILETPDAFVFVSDCPGLVSTDVHVRVTHNLIQLSGAREPKAKPSGSHYHRRERATGKFCRTFRMPDGADYKDVKAVCEHGVLTVTVKKDEETRRAAVRAADMLALGEGDGSLNAEFKQVPMSVFPTPALGKIVMVRSDMSLLEAVRVLSEHRVLSAPVLDVNAPADAGWVDKYIGIVDMTGIVFHMLDRLDPAREPTDFNEEVAKVESFRNTTVKDAITYSGFGPFVPVDYDKGTLLDCMLLCGQHGFRRLPVVKTPGGDVVNIVTQSALVQTLGANLERFKAVGGRTLEELGLGQRGTVLSVTENQPLQDAFDLIRQHDVSAVPVLDGEGRIKGNVSARDARLIVSSTKIYKLLKMPVSTYLDVVTDGSQFSAITCPPTEKMEDVVRLLTNNRIHRVYVVDEDRKPIRVVSLRNVLTKFCKEPQGYFGHFFS